ncbi:MAG: hypothetical protein V3R86_01765, partial [Candidatus Hydrothermarchaeaceae archaeon]
WRPLNNLNPMKRNKAEILKGKLSRQDINGGTKISFSIKDRYYDYVLEILELNEDSVMEDVYDKDKYFLVIEGDFLISSDGIKKQCSKNDYIVIDKNTAFDIKTKTKSRLYTIS